MIVSDSTTLIILADLNRFELLTNLFDGIIIPKIVYQEINAKQTIKLPTVIKVKTVRNTQLLALLNQLLDQGESEAIALAIQLKTGLIIDEKKGRKIAKNQGLKIIGLLGIILLNIQKSYLTKKQAQEFLADAIEHGYRISEKLIDEMFECL